LGIKIVAGVKCINHSQFADEILSLARTSLIIARRFKTVMDQFLSASGGLVNSHKCCLYACNTNAYSLIVISRILQFPLVSNWRCFKYLGIPICLNSLSAADWNIITSKISEKFTSWGVQWLNPTQRLVLAKAILSALPVFQYSSMLAPSSVKTEIAHQIRKFLGKEEILIPKGSI